MKYDLRLDHSTAVMVAENSPKTIPESCNDMPSTGVGHDDPDFYVHVAEKEYLFDTDITAI